MKHSIRYLILCLTLFSITAVTSAQETNLNIQISYQGFERGFMIWRSDNGHIWVFNYSQTVLNFPASSYSRLPDNPIRDTSRIMPIFGFGKVWGNNANVRDLIGYPIAPEIGGTLQYKQIMPANIIYIAFADVFKAQIEPNGQWFGGGLNPNSQISSLASNNPNPRVNDTITISWQGKSESSGSYAMLEVYDVNNALLRSQSVQLSGSFDLPIPNTTKVTVMVWVVDYLRGSMVLWRSAYSSLVINISGATATNPAPTATPTVTCVSGSTYIVQRGDTLSRIARRCGVTVTALATRNNIVNRNRIFVGQQLIIP